MNDPQLLSILRSKSWSGVPSSPGVYWWYFPRNELDRFQIAKLCEVTNLRLRSAPDDMVCLYHGMANNLAERVEWHAAQKLTLQSLRSGWLSTFRFTLLALNNFDFLAGSDQIDGFFDSLSVSWEKADSREEAKTMENMELQSEYHYPLNITGNRRPELRRYLQFLKSARRDYKERYL